jgi:hypothetical protein
MRTCLSVPSGINPLPERIITHRRRFSSGLWLVPEGDISAAYCADTFPKVEVFTHEGRLFTNSGGHFSGRISASADCYPLMPGGEYPGLQSRRYSYEGREACYQRRVFILGPKAIFIASEPTVEEWRCSLRVMYADGGWFARHQTYALFLTEQPAPKSESGNEALRLELAHELSGFTKEMMNRWLDASAIHSINHQLDLSL